MPFNSETASKAGQIFLAFNCRMTAKKRLFKPFFSIFEMNNY